jgi:hypothetical protein
MFGRGGAWEKARATILDVHVQAKGAIAYGDRFAAEIVCSDGYTFRSEICLPRVATDFRAPSTGDKVGVEVERASRKVRFDKDDPQLSHKAQRQAEEQAFKRSLES